jgi:uncharacterized protein (TIGR01319 family)
MTNKYENLSVVVVTDCGSTTTKALMFEKTPEGWRHTFRGESPTTVEEPVADVTVGVVNSFLELQEISKRNFLVNDNENINFPYFKKDGDSGIDLYLSTSSAGGGLQMVVAGVVAAISTESAQRAALGAGAIVLECFSGDDGLEDFQIIEKLRQLKPDIVLLSGGIDNGATLQVIEYAELLRAAYPRPRFGNSLKLPVIYAGNKEIVADVKEILNDIYSFDAVQNVRPELSNENLAPARDQIHEIFLTHVMSHSPGYEKLLKWCPEPIIPTPAAVGDMVQAYAHSTNSQVLCADIGGATTDIFSVCKNREDNLIFNRTVSANYGMSYSIANVLTEAGIEAIVRWLPFKIDLNSCKDIIRNKMIRPTSIPQTKEDLWIEQAVCREALRLSLEHHRSLAIGLSSVSKVRGISEIFKQEHNRYQLLDLMKLNTVIGSGGVLSHAPSRRSSALMMIDGFALEGLTQLTVDSIFMMPHLGVFSTVDKNGALEIFNRDCILSIGWSIVPIYSTRIAQSELVDVLVNGKKLGCIRKNEVNFLEVKANTTIELTLMPLHKSIDVGLGKGIRLIQQITTGSEGLFLDGRNRPLTFYSNLDDNISKQEQIFRNLGLI